MSFYWRMTQKVKNRQIRICSVELYTFIFWKPVSPGCLNAFLYLLESYQNSAVCSDGINRQNFSEARIGSDLVRGLVTIPVTLHVFTIVLLCSYFYVLCHWRFANSNKSRLSIIPQCYNCISCGSSSRSRHATSCIQQERLEFGNCKVIM